MPSCPTDSCLVRSVTASAFLERVDLGVRQDRDPRRATGLPPPLAARSGPSPRDPPDADTCAVCFSGATVCFRRRCRSRPSSAPRPSCPCSCRPCRRRRRPTRSSPFAPAFDRGDRGDRHRRVLDVLLVARLAVRARFARPAGESCRSAPSSRDATRTGRCAPADSCCGRRAASGNRRASPARSPAFCVYCTDALSASISSPRSNAFSRTISYALFAS